mgnify:FL=1
MLFNSPDTCFYLDHLLYLDFVDLVCTYCCWSHRQPENSWTCSVLALLPVIFDLKICWFNLYLAVLESLIDCRFIVEMNRTTWYDNLKSK